jgi:uncharacterized damage-inducible protein DinB
MNTLIRSIDKEFRDYKAVAEGAFAQVPEAALSASGLNEGNSLAAMCWHISENLKSRFTDFLTTDGEKPWRRREDEFSSRSVSREEFVAKWEEGWNALLGTLATLQDSDLLRTVKVRGESVPAHEVVHHALAHISYHIGQIVYLSHAIAGAGWKYLSIPPGASVPYIAPPEREVPSAPAAAVKQ